jgi:hypothetical protein
MRAAIAFTTDYVKTRNVFGRPLGSFQAIQHRLSIDVPSAEGAYWTGLRAAWSESPLDAASALLHAQGAVTRVIFDTHQFNGALGLRSNIRCTSGRSVCAGWMANWVAPMSRPRWLPILHGLMYDRARRAWHS